MMRLSQMLHGWQGEARYFDFYERALYNHVLSQQHPEGGRYTYMTPLLTGEARSYSDPEGQFWCCVGTGMESHAQYTDGIYGFRDGELLVNLYIPSTCDDSARGVSLRMESGLPDDGTVRITLGPLREGALPALRLRVPEWAGDCRIRVNGREVKPEMRDGYARIRRAWREGARIEVGFAMPLRLEPCGDHSTLVSLRRGPCVIAADLGPADAPWDGIEPWLPDGIETAFGEPEGGRWRVALPTPPQGLEFVAFHALPERRSREQALRERSLDHIELGDGDSEQAHALAVTGDSYAASYRRVSGRDVRDGGTLEFTLRGDRPAAALRLRYWGEEHRRRFAIEVNGRAVAHEVLDGGRGHEFVMVDYPLPADLRAPSPSGWRVRIVPDAGYSAGPVFGAWLLAG